MLAYVNHVSGACSWFVWVAPEQLWQTQAFTFVLSDFAADWQPGKTELRLPGESFRYGVQTSSRSALGTAAKVGHLSYLGLK